jgi:hypothetical protein
MYIHLVHHIHINKCILYIYIHIYIISIYTHIHYMCIAINGVILSLHQAFFLSRRGKESQQAQMITGKPQDLHGKIDGFRCRFSQENQSIEWGQPRKMIYRWLGFHIC